MKKLVIVGAAVTGAALLARNCAAGCSRMDFGKLIERMPEDAPPKWVFRNITAIRQNTERILELLEREEAQADAETAHATA